MKTVKHSKQRECINNYLMSRKDHPTADMVYSAVREVFPNISLGTVYRNLSFLEEHGEIIKLNTGGGSERYDAKTDRHYHFICSSCGAVMDLEMMPLDHIEVIAGEKFDGQIEDHIAYFYGRCGDCFKKEADKKLMSELENSDTKRLTSL